MGAAATWQRWSNERCRWCGTAGEVWSPEIRLWVCATCKAVVEPEDDVPPAPAAKTTTYEGERRARRIAEAWLDTLDLNTALEAARTVVTPIMLTPEDEHDVEAIAVDVLLTRRKHHGLGLSDALIRALASRADDALREP